MKEEATSKEGVEGWKKVLLKKRKSGSALKSYMHFMISQSFIK